MATLSAFNYDGGSKITEIEIANPIEYSTSVRAKDLNDIANKLNEIIEYTNTINNSGNTTNNNITINGNIISGEISGNIKSVITDTVSISKETSTSGTILAWTIDGNTNSINIENEKWLSSVNYNETNKTIDFTVTNGNIVNIPVSTFINEYTNNDFSLSGLADKSYNSLTDKPTLSGNVISGSIDNILTEFVKNIDGVSGEVNKIEEITVNGTSSGVTITDKIANIIIDIPELPTIETTLTETSTNDTVAGSKAVIDYVSAYVSGKIEDLNIFDGNYNSLTDLPTISGQIITNEISGSIIPIVDSVINNNIMQTKTISDITGYTLEHNTFTKISNTVSSLTLNIVDSNIKAMCLLTTVSGTTEPTISFNYPDTYLINKDITFKNDTTYLIAAENDIILWTELVK